MRCACGHGVELHFHSPHQKRAGIRCHAVVHRDGRAADLCACRRFEPVEDGSRVLLSLAMAAVGPWVVVVGALRVAEWTLGALARLAWRPVRGLAWRWRTLFLPVVLVVVVLAAGCGEAMFVRLPVDGGDDAAGVDGGAAVDVEVDTRPAIPTCGPGAIVIRETCNLPESGEWLCQVAEAREDLPCAVPNLHRFIVGDCGLCAGVLR